MSQNINQLTPNPMYAQYNPNSGQIGMQNQDTSMMGMLEESMLERYDEIHVAEILADDEDDDGELPHPIDNAPIKAPQTGAGAGPLPQGFGTTTTQTAGSTLTGFTKRRNWAQRVVEELKDFLHILTPDGRIIYISENSKEITGYSSEDLEGKFIVDFIHPDDSGIFVREFNESIASGHTLRFFYRFRKQNNEYTIFESHGHPHFTTDASPFGPNSTASICGGFFLMARPYPTKMAALLDSFLEHKIENERLKKKIEALRKEEEDEAIEYQRQWTRQQEGSTETPEDSQDTPLGGSSLVTGRSLGLSNPDQIAMPPPAKPSAINTALTRQNLEDATAGARPDSMDDKMARYEGVNHYETIELLTGLRYQEGERSQGISTGDPQPALIRGDVGIILPVDKESRGGDKKKKLKVTEEFVCTDCGTLDSPEWRKGPSGRKTLCNACGLRWAKKEKKKSGPSPVAGAGPGGNSAGRLAVPPPATAVSSTT